MAPKLGMINLCKAAALGPWSVSGVSHPVWPELAAHCPQRCPHWGCSCQDGGFTPFFFWQGPATVEESVQGVLRLLAQLSATNNGTFWDWRGQSLPW